MRNRLFIAALVACVSLCGSAEELDYWLADATAKTITDGVWTFAATIDTSKKTVVVGACVPETGFPAELSTLDLSKTVKDSSDKVYTITSLATLFGKTTNYWKPGSVTTTTGLTLGKVILPTTITSIGAGAFGACASLTNVVNFLPDSVTSVGDSCFYLTEVQDDLYAYGVTSFGRCDFMGVPIRSVHFGKNLTAIGNGSNGQGAFQYCGSLTNVTFHPESKGIEIQKCGLNAQTADGAEFPLYLYGVSVIGESGLFGARCSEVVFDKGLRSIHSTSALLNNYCTKCTFLGAPPKTLSVQYHGVNSKITTYVPAAYRQKWEQLTAGPIPDDGETTFSATVCSASGVSNVANRPVKLIPGSLPVEIGTAAAFVAQLNNNPSSFIKLTADIDLTDSGYTTLERFEGYLDGQGHTISGVGAQPLFDFVRGEIHNLTLDGTVSGAKTYIKYAAAQPRGAFCNTLSIGVIKNCRIKGYKIAAPSYAATSWVGLFVGRAYNEAVIEGCETDESCELFGSNNGYGGGLVGSAYASGSPAHGPMAVDCTNRAAVAYSQEVYGGGGLGGIIGNLSASTSKSEVRRCVNYHIIKSDFKGATMGGILGSGSASISNRLIVADCVNYGNVEAKATGGGFTLGGIVGSAGHLTVSNCVNLADVSVLTNSSGVAGNGSCGGIIGQNSSIAKPSAGTGIAFFYDCANYGDITSPNASGYAGGIFGKITMNDDYGTYMKCRNCANYGTLNATYIGEACPWLYDEKKRIVAKATSRYTIQNCFFMTTNLHYRWTATYGWCTESGNITAQETGTDPASAKISVATLNAGAAELGLGSWCRGRIDEMVLPELKNFSLDPLKPGLQIIIR